MSWMDGFSQCSRLGVDRCVVWWDAWAATGSILAAVVAAISAYAVWRLGTRANALAEVTQRAVDEDRKQEANFLRNYIFPEFAVVHTALDTWLTSWPTPKTRIVFFSEHEEIRKEARDVAFGELSSVDLTQTKSVISRLHVFSGEEAKAVANALARSSIVIELIRRMHSDAEILEDYESKFDGLTKKLTEYRDHIGRFIELAAAARLEQDQASLVLSESAGNPSEEMEPGEGEGVTTTSGIAPAK
ncbi:hypothetical protein NDN68_07830 [Stenotrophomonas maltophilia]|uniref:hypothetical protein n=1 Tax=Stenotrophomonas maltophilia TaxID=40324 RepID=UPI002036BC84|nr:hypothetical protein [Stenotrophomonas maltophilia]MCM2519887.1 hypothetical protein [Stenotrophomonas maltophilia]